MKGTRTKTSNGIVKKPLKVSCLRAPVRWVGFDIARGDLLTVLLPHSVLAVFDFQLLAFNSSTNELSYIKLTT